MADETTFTISAIIFFSSEIDAMASEQSIVIAVTI